ncbi:TonB-dependent receptor [bacterium]|nr:TonB-dependent receptor [bacterium]
MAVPRTPSNHRLRLAAALVALWALGPFGLAARLAADPYVLPPQVVEDRAPVEPLAPAAARSSYSGEELEALGVASVSEALELAPGLDLAPVGGAGAQTAVSLRGSTSGQVLVIVDGVRVSDPATGQCDLSRLGLDLADIESIEVIRGGASAQYGADALGGVVVITTKKGGGASGGPSLTLRAANRSCLPSLAVSGSGANAVGLAPSAAALVDGQSLSFRASLPGGFALSASAERQANAYAYYDASGTRRIRSNAGLLQGGAGLSWKGQAGEGSLSASANLSARSLGVPGPLDMPTPEALQRDLDASFASRYATDYFFSDSVGFDTSAYARFGVLEYRKEGGSEADLHRAARAGSDAKWSLLFGEASAANLGLSARYDRLDSTVVKGSSGGAPERLSLGAFAEPFLARGSWTIAPALRWDWTSDFDSGLSAGLGATKALSDRASMSFSATTSYRAPSFDDLYWPSAGGAEGDPALRPESGYSGEAGFRWKEGATSASAAVYLRYAKDVILWRQRDDGIWRPSNYGDALYPGLELEGRSQSGDWSFVGSYAFLYSYVLSGTLSLSDDKRVPGAPVHSLSGSATYSSKGFSGGLKLSYKGLRYTTTDNRDYLPAVFLAGASLRWALGERLSLFWNGDNLLNERYVSEKNYPMPGLTIETGLEYKL